MVNFVSRIQLSQWFGYSSAIVLAYLTGMVTAFILVRLFVFPSSSQSLQNSFLLFVVVNLAAVVQTWAVAIFLASYLLPAIGIARFIPEIAHAVGIAVPVFTSYLGHKMYSFR